MKAIIKFFILYFCINIDIISSTCDPVKNWADNYEFTGIAQECRWYIYSRSYSDSNVTQGKKIEIKDSTAYILHPDSYFGYYPEIPFYYKRMDCEFTVEAPQNNGIAVSIQQMNFDKQCSDFIQFTNHNGSLNKTICDKFVGNIPRSYPGSGFLGEFESDKYNTSKQEIFNADGQLKVKISVTEKNFKYLSYLFIVFTAIKKDVSIDNKQGKANFSLATKYYCDGIKNYNEAIDETNCTTLKNVEKQTDKKQTVENKGFFGSFDVFLIIFIIFGCSEALGICYMVIRRASPPPTVPNGSHDNSANNNVPVQPPTTVSNSVALEITPDVIDKDSNLPTYQSVLPEEQNQAATTSAK